MESEYSLISHTCNFFQKKIFSFPKKIQLLDQEQIFLSVGSDHHLYFEKNYNNWIKSKLSKTQTKCTGLLNTMKKLSKFK